MRYLLTENKLDLNGLLTEILMAESGGCLCLSNNRGGINNVNFVMNLAIQAIKNHPRKLR